MVSTHSNIMSQKVGSIIPSKDLKNKSEKHYPTPSVSLANSGYYMLLPFGYCMLLPF